MFRIFCVGRAKTKAHAGISVLPLLLFLLPLTSDTSAVNLVLVRTGSNTYAMRVVNDSKTKLQLYYQPVDDLDALFGSSMTT
jgi:hypothetical protein